MGFKEWWFGEKTSPNLPAIPVTYETVNPNPLVMVTSNGLEVTVNLDELLQANPSQLFKTQPFLRSVISFLGRNIAQLGLSVFIRASDEERVRVDGSSVAAALLRSPNPAMTRYELLDALVCDMALNDQAFWYVSKDAKRDIGWRITHIPTAWVQAPGGGDAFEPDYWSVTAPGSMTRNVPANEMIHFHGWNPTSQVYGTSPVVTLKNILMEQIASVIYRQQRWEKGARVGNVITRPMDAPKWSVEAEDRFRQEWRTGYTGRAGTDAGGTPILQDGMTLSKVGFSAVEDEFVEASKLALTTVAAVYHVNPTMVGLLDNANYSNVREFRRMLYGDTLGPWLAMIEGRINSFLLPMLGEPANEYVEFNINEKLQGSFEEQAQVASMAVGGPYMTRNEYRARQNLPPIDGGDELIVPMNVVTGGQPSPQTPLSAPLPMRLAAGGRGAERGPDRSLRASSGPLRLKYKASKQQIDGTTLVLRRFYRRQRDAVLSALGSKDAATWWNEDRWNEELTKDLTKVSRRISTDLGNKVLDSLGVDQPYDVDATDELLTKVMATRAESINATTKDQLDAALEDEADAEDGEDFTSPADVFEEAENVRAPTGAVSLTTTIAGIAMNEAGKQAAPGGGATKTWQVNSAKSRHPEMDGETVPIEENFSNGAAWPGDAVLGPDETSGCMCELIINVP